MINIYDEVLDKDVCGVYNCRPSYRQDYDLDYSGPGDYTIRGFLSRPDLRRPERVFRSLLKTAWCSSVLVSAPPGSSIAFYWVLRLQTSPDTNIAHGTVCNKTDRLETLLGKIFPIDNTTVLIVDIW